MMVSAPFQKSNYLLSKTEYKITGFKNIVDILLKKKQLVSLPVLGAFVADITELLLRYYFFPLII